ncbi:MAG: glutamate racemase [Gammaproteobacteria bacterium]
MASASDPVGVFDSGIGGLSVLQEIRRLLPAEDLCYVADAAYMPYGERPKALVRERALKIARFLVDEQHCKAIVVACNTATGIAVDLLRKQLDVPVIAIEPAIKPASELTKTGVVGVMATPGTLSGEKFGELHSRFSRDTKIISQPCPGLAKAIESGKLNSIRLRKLLTRFIKPLVDQNADVIVLGCTHYPFVRPLIRELAGQDVRIIDSGEAVARQLQRKLAASGLENGSGQEGHERFWCSSEPGACRGSIAPFWTRDVCTMALPA